MLMLLCRLGVLIMYKDVCDKGTFVHVCGINVVVTSDTQEYNVLCDVN